MRLLGARLRLALRVLPVLRVVLAGLLPLRFLLAALLL